MSPLLKDYLGQRIVIITTEGQCFVATLEGFDKNTNMLISNVRSRSNNALVSMAQVLRGSEVVLCGLLVENEALNLDTVPTLKDTKNKIQDEYLIWEQVWEKQAQK